MASLHTPRFTLSSPRGGWEGLSRFTFFSSPRGGREGAPYGTSTLLIIVLMISSCVTLVASAS